MGNLKDIKKLEGFIERNCSETLVFFCSQNIVSNNYLLKYLRSYSKIIHVYSSVVEHMFPKYDVVSSTLTRRGFLNAEFQIYFIERNSLRFVTQLGRVVALQVTRHRFESGRI